MFFEEICCSVGGRLFQAFVRLICLQRTALYKRVLID